jgi:hypothetical protein
VNCRVDVSREPGRAVVRIYGRLSKPAVPELERVCREARGVLVLDVTHLMSADDAGVATLKRLMSNGVPCTGVSPYLALLLGQE